MQDEGAKTCSITIVIICLKQTGIYLRYVRTMVFSVKNEKSM